MINKSQEEKADVLQRYVDIRKQYDNLLLDLQQLLLTNVGNDLFVYLHDSKNLLGDSYDKLLRANHFYHQLINEVEE